MDFDRDKILSLAKEVLDLEGDAIKGLKPRLGDDFFKALEIVINTSGRVVVSGMGKSGILGKKLASTLASTGTPAFFIHPGEGAHGDLGMLVKGDVLIAISYSGETQELKMLLPVIKNLELPMILITGNPQSSLGLSSDVILNIKVEKEASPFGLIPTCSSAATLGLGDALAICLLNLKGFRREDFAVIHPSGTLGYILNMRINDFTHKGNKVPIISEEKTIKDALFEITKKGFGFTLIGTTEEIKGIITDGDIRRLLEKNEQILDLKCGDVMSRNPKSIENGRTIADALEVMEKHSITSLVVRDHENNFLGIVHLHDLLGRGKLKIGYNNEG